MKTLLFILRHPLKVLLPFRSFSILFPLIALTIPAMIIAYKISPPASGISEQLLLRENIRLQQQIISCGPVSNSFFYSGLETIEPNDNRMAAGQLKNGVLTINLEAREGAWYPETPVNPGIPVYAFAEEGKALQLPGPLIRVPEGTEIKLTLKNSIPGKALHLHGFHERPGKEADSVTLQAGEVWITQFKTGSAGTYHYNANTDGAKNRAGWPRAINNQLYGGFIVDAANEKADPAERIMFIGIAGGIFSDQKESREVDVINGLSWPYTERLNYKKGETVKWRVINTSVDGHSMHLHGFYFDVLSRGNGEKDQPYSSADIRRAATEQLPSGETMRMSWVPKRPGNWLFHCHMLGHIFQKHPLQPRDSIHHDLTRHLQEEMAGIIMGIHVSGKEEFKKRERPKRNITLIAKNYPARYDSLGDGMGFLLTENIPGAATSLPSIPGLPIILQRDEPVAIRVVNQLKEPTVVHWHGIEIENYFDGVAGFGFSGNMTTPLILPGQSFVAELKPPNAGTFIYHTHMHDHQLSSGLYGPLIVMEPGKKFDPATDKIIMISKAPKPGAGKNPTINFGILFNGSIKPEPMRLKTGVRYRLRIINITENQWPLYVSLLLNDKPVSWKAIAKDGLDLPEHQSRLLPADKQLVTVGETRDFYFTPTQPGEYKFNIYPSPRPTDAVMIEAFIMLVQ